MVYASSYMSPIFQLQIESEERLHDYGERIRALQREKEEILSKLEDKQKDLDDISFQLEEESITKADLEVNIKTYTNACVLFYLLKPVVCMHIHCPWCTQFLWDIMHCLSNNTMSAVTSFYTFFYVY